MNAEFQRFREGRDQAHRDRERMLEKVDGIRAAQQTPYPAPDSTEDIIPNHNYNVLITFVQRFPRPIRVASVAAALMGSLAACAPQPEETPQPTIPVGKTRTEPNRLLPIEGEVYLTQGVHAWDDASDGVKSSIDVAPKRGGDCPPGARITIDEQDVIATTSGTIKTVGNPNDRNDKNHSVIEIEEADTGLIWRVMHVDKISPNIQTGEKVKAGEKMAKASCETMPGGYTSGPHAHLDVREVNGTYIPINGFIFSGWTVDGDTMKDGNLVRVADKGRCNTEAACGGKLNVLQPRDDIFVADIKRKPTPLVATATPPPTMPKPAPTPFNPPTQKINISGIQMNDFTISPIFVNQNGDTSFVRNTKFEFVYLKQFSEFIIDISSPPFDQNRQEAENLFLEKLGITQEQACKLIVWISNTSNDPKFSWEKRRLSFCEKNIIKD